VVTGLKTSFSRLRGAELGPYREIIKYVVVVHSGIGSFGDTARSPGLHDPDREKGEW